MRQTRMFVLAAAAVLFAGALRAAETGGQPADKPAPAAEKPGKGGGKGPCKADIEKFCKDVQPGGGRIIECLKAHDAELSDACKKRGERAHERREKMRETVKVACKGDYEKLCKGVEPGEGRIVKCLKDHEAELSEGCKKLGERVEAAREKREERREKREQRKGGKKDKADQTDKPADQPAETK